jgi:hypothetical protein
MKIWVSIFLFGMTIMAMGNSLQASESGEKVVVQTAETPAAQEEGLMWDIDGDGRMSDAEQQAAWLKIREKRKSPFIPRNNEKEPLKPSKK